MNARRFRRREPASLAERERLFYNGRRPRRLPAPVGFARDVCVNLAKVCLLPPRCVLCRKPLPQRDYGICRECYAALSPLEGRNWAWRKHGQAGCCRYADAVVTPLPYTGNTRTALTALKFHARPQYAGGFAPTMADALRAFAVALRLPAESLPEVVTWVPVSPRRRRERGYDQAELLAKAVGKLIGVQAVRGLRKSEDNSRQMELSAAGRVGNVIGVYDVLPENKLFFVGRTVLLVDDIVTTGATLNEAAKTLRFYLPESVICLAAARTMPREQKEEPPSEPERRFEFV